MAKPKKGKFIALNRKIVHGIITGQWDIEIQSAHRYIEEYLAAIELLEAGADFKELGYSERRLQLAPTVILPGQMLSTNQGRDTINLSNAEVPQGTIAHLKLTGAMRSQDGFSSRGVGTLARQIADAQNNPNIGGIILEVQSGGGETVAGTMLQNAIQEVTKPFWVYTHLLASAAIKGTLPADQVIASGEETTIGSIGTMLTLNKKLIEFYKQYEEDIYADNSTGKNKEFRAYLNGDKGPFIEKLNQVNDVFIHQVQEHRHIIGTQEQVDRVFSGETILASEAQEVGLIDGIGTFGDVVSGIRSDMQRGQFFIKRIQGLEHKAPTILINSKNSEMKFTINSFWAKLFPMLNKKYGYEFKADTDFQTALDTIEGAKSLDDIKAELKAEILQELKPSAAPAQSNADDESQEDESQEMTVEQQIKQLLQTVNAQQAQINQLLQNNKGLESQVAKFKSAEIDQNEDGEHDTTNGNGNPSTQQFATITNFNMATKLKGAKSKF